MSLQQPRDHLHPLHVPSGVRQSPGRAGRRRAKPGSSLEEQQKLGGPSASSKEQECEREKVISPWFCVSSQLLFSSFPSPSFLVALSAPERSVLCWGIKRRQLRLFSEALKGHENTHITGAESPGASSGKKKSTSQFWEIRHISVLAAPGKTHLPALASPIVSPAIQNSSAPKVDPSPFPSRSLGSSWATTLTSHHLPPSSHSPAPQDTSEMPKPRDLHDLNTLKPSQLEHVTRNQFLIPSFPNPAGICKHLAAKKGFSPF